MKKIINRPESVVQDMCSGIVLAHPELKLNSRHRFIYKSELNGAKVSLICGGGSGHEPAHAGFVGKGLLDAAVCGEVFASPSQIQVYQAIRQVAGDKGVLLIIKNYSGDVMNFESAARLASEDGIAVECVKIDDDIAVRDSLYTVGRRGVAGTIFVHKLAGAAAESGKDLSEVKRVAEKAIANVKSIGFALTSCTVPAKGSPIFSLDENEMEYGVGIHGEPGVRRENMMPARELAGRMTASLLSELKLDCAGRGRVAVLINGFGATPLMELYILNKEVAREFAEKGITIVRSFVGNYMSSLDMSGASISVLRLDDELESCLNAPCKGPAMQIDGPVPPVEYADFFPEKAQCEVSYTVETPQEYAKIGETLSLGNMMYIIDIMSRCIIRNEIPFCELDAHAGDGDFGMSIAKGFRRLKEEWKTIIAAPGLTVSGFLDACSLVIMEHCGGASGPIWGAAFRAAGINTAGKTSLTTADFAEMLQAAVKGIQTTGQRFFGRGALVGDKTLIDALVPCADTWTAAAQRGASWKDAFISGAAAAAEGAEATKDIVARMGRAGNVGQRSLGYHDAGAHALGVIFTEIAQSLM